MFSGNLVNIRMQTLSDMEHLAAFRNRPHIMDSFIHEMPRFTYKEQLEKKLKERLDRRHGDTDVHLTVETKDGKVIGAVGLDFIFWKNGFGAMYLYIGDEAYIGGGYREEALDLFLEFAFKEANVRKIKIQVLADDAISVGIYKSKGFQVEVVYHEEVLRHGKYLDVLELALLKEEYEK